MTATLGRAIAPFIVGAFAIAAAGTAPTTATAQSLDASSAGRDVMGLIGPPPPVAPAVFARDDDGRVTLRATRVSGLSVDGDLGEPFYEQVASISHFIQQEPFEGQVATERTEAWLLFDERNFYVAVRCYDSEPGRLVANERRRDNFNIFQNDNITVSIDPLYSRRSGYFFQVNALGALRDQEVADERNNNNDWNTVWDARTRVLEDGWSLEIAIPFKSLRFKNTGPQLWGFNLRRVVRWKNEQTSIAPIPASAGFRAMYRFDIAASLVGVETPSQGPNLEVKPYAISALTTNTTSTPPSRNDATADAGFDVKYGLTKSLVADFTYRTDFSQVEEDQQQVNLTRFSLFFPEKRDFFLEGQGIFLFGADQRGGGGGGAPQGARASTPALAPVVFFSRRIGLNSSGLEVPIVAGGRLTGRAGKFSVGALNIQTGESVAAAAAATNFTVLRLRRDVLQRSNIGLIYTRRDPSGGGPENTVIGTDVNFWFQQNVTLTGFVAQSATAGETATAKDRTSYRGEFEFAGDRYGAKLERLFVGDRFSPEVGFLRRQAFTRTYGQLRFSPRPARSTLVRKHNVELDFDYITDNGGRLETRETKLAYRLELNNNDQWAIDYSRNFEFLRTGFDVVPRVRIGAGAYGFGDFRTVYQFGPQRRVSGSLTFGTGSFYDGRLMEASYRGYVDVGPTLSLEPGVTLNFIELPAREFVTKLVSTRANYMFSTRALLSAFLQFNSTTFTLSSSVRLRWEYRPGSDLFVVYSDGRNTDVPGFAELQNRTFAVKVTRLLRF